MSAPANTARQTPVGQPMRKGYRSLVVFKSNPAIIFWEKGVTPPGLDGGDAIDSTTMHNDTYRTLGPQALVTMTEMSCRVAYDVDLYDDIIDLINVEDEITVHFATGRCVSFWGFLRSFEADEMVESGQPEATITIQPTNWDPNTNEEEPPVVGTSGTQLA